MKNVHKLLIFLILLSPSCVAIKVGPSIYNATKLDILAVLNAFPGSQIAFGHRLWHLFDLPFSFALETATLPAMIITELLKIVYY